MGWVLKLLAFMMELVVVLDGWNGGVCVLLIFIYYNNAAPWRVSPSSSARRFS